MKALLDTCIIIDTLQNREPFCNSSNEIFLLVANEKFQGYITAKSLTDIYYLVHKSTHSMEKSKIIIQKLFSLFQVLDTAAVDCKKAILTSMADYEDVVMIESAKHNEMDCIITRNVKDYKTSSIPVYTPEQFIDWINYN